MKCFNVTWKQNKINKIWKSSDGSNNRLFKLIRIKIKDLVQYKDLKMIMIDLLAASAIMRSKLFKFAKLNLWLIFSPNYWPSVHKIIRSHDRTCD